MTNYFENLYDDLLLEANGPVSVADGRTAFIAEVARAAREGDLPKTVHLEMNAEIWAELMYYREVNALRDRRRTSLGKVIKGLRDVLAGTDDDLRELGKAFPVGDGTDLSLRYWGREHWARAVQVRRDKAVEATDKAMEFSEDAAPILEAFDKHSARFTWQLFEKAEVK